ncbi:SDR family oxidoreductase [Alcaligenaceae bacterium B3P038]|nr:SDR family oxidoreductase [Alcaligenaceae bacterium B3P038]
MDLNIAGRRALVTGASKGLGRSCAWALARAQVELTIVARDARTLQDTADAIHRDTGALVHTVAADVATPEGRAAVLRACPHPDILVNNAGGKPPGDFRNWSRDDWIAGVDLMMLTPIEMIRATFDGMAERGYGRIVNIVSRSVKAAHAELGLSNAARSGLVGFVAGIARQHASRNVTVNNLLPGIFATGAQIHHVEKLAEETGESFDTIWQRRAAGNPSNRYGDPDELGNYCAFLCSAHAGFITGQNLLIDGGDYRGTF